MLLKILFNNIILRIMINYKHTLSSVSIKIMSEIGKHFDWHKKMQKKY